MNLLQWLIPWEPSAVVIIAMGATAFLYIAGCARYPVCFWQKIYFWLGLASLYIALQTQFDYYSEHAFFMHRLQHAVLHHLGPFLIALSNPGAALAAGLPMRWRQKGTAFLTLASIQYAISFLVDPIVAVLLFSGLILLWLVPHIHLVAMLDWRLYRVMNWSMALNGLVFWSLVLSPSARHSAGCRIMMMLAIIPPQIAIGALLFLSPHDLYPVYSLCGRIFAGLSPLADQQTGGLILWICGAMTSAIGILIVASREWMSDKATALVHRA